jgi:hypothetical protein
MKWSFRKVPIRSLQGTLEDPVEALIFYSAIRSPLGKASGVSLENNQIYFGIIFYRNFIVSIKWKKEGFS